MDNKFTTMNNMITIFGPTKKMGGTTILLVNLALLLTKQNDQVQVYYVDYPNGDARKTITNKTDRIIFIDFFDKPIVIETGMFIAILLHVKILKEIVILRNGVKMLFWVTHPEDAMKLLPSFNLWYRLGTGFLKSVISNVLHPNLKNKMALFISEGMNKGGIVWMDQFNYEEAKAFYKLTEKPVFWPLVTDNLSSNTSFDSTRFSKEKILNICIIGRLVKFKVLPILGMLDSIKLYKDKIKIDFIGGGPMKSEVVNKLDDLGFLNSHFLGEIPKIKLDDVLVGYDLIIGHGNSVLEGAKLGIPSLIIPGSNYMVDSTQIRLPWVFEVPPTFVGYLLKRKEVFKYGRNLNEILMEIFDDGDLTKIGTACGDHWNQYHSAEKFAVIVNIVLDRNTFRYTSDIGNSLKGDLLSQFINVVKKQITK